MKEREREGLRETVFVAYRENVDVKNGFIAIAILGSYQNSAVAVLT